jgi:hypothetical protein
VYDRRGRTDSDEKTEIKLCLFKSLIGRKAIRWKGLKEYPKLQKHVKIQSHRKVMESSEAAPSAEMVEDFPEKNKMP